MLRREQSRTSAATAHSADAHQPRPNEHGRKLSRGKTEPGKKGLLSRKSVKQTDDSQPPETAAPPPVQKQHSSDKGKEREGSFDSFSLFNHASIVPDPLQELPAWYRLDVERATAHAAHFRTKYPLHNRSGPRYYRNLHLLPPARENDAPATFSPSFPPMPSAPEHSQDPIRLANRSRTPSGSPLPTPSSSQIRIHDPNTRVRSRKTSQNGPDHVDIVEISDPWGSSFHNQSPYDVGVHPDPGAAAPEPESPTSPVASRPRRRSFNAGIGRHKTVTPSPLSQSTSAIHLHAYVDTDHQITRKLTKRRKPFAGLFGTHHNSPKRASDRPAPSSSQTPSPHSTTTRSEQALARSKSTKRESSLVPSSSPMSSPPPDGAGRSEKRGSMLGRLARRFSILRRPDASKSPIGIDHDWQDVTSPDTLGRQPSPGAAPSGEARRISVHPSKSQEPVKRVPPPSLAPDPEPLQSTSRSVASKKDDDDQSVTSESLGSPTRGKLTVANPDEPSDSNDTTPVKPKRQLSPVASPQLPSLTIPQQPEVLPIASPIQPVSPGSVSLEGSVREVAFEYLPEIPGSEVSLVRPAQVSHTSLPVPPKHDVIHEEDTPMPPPSPPLPAIPFSPPPPNPPPNYDHTLPPTPVSTRPSSPALTERTISPSMRLSQTDQSLSHAASMMTVMTSGVTSTMLDESPLSRMSMLANPPTPHAISAILIPDASTMPKNATNQGRAAPSDPSPTKEKDGSRRVKGSKSRQTETFMLVRSPSGTVHPQGDLILAMGEQWAVVESPVDQPKRTRNRERSRSREPMDERPARERGDTSLQKRQYPTNTSRNDPRAKPSTSPTRGGADAYHRPESRVHVPGPADERAPDLERGRSRRQEPSATKSSSHSRDPEDRNSLGRNTSGRTSGSARPTSGLPSAAEMNTLKAKDAWEMERLWKARSMAYGPDGVPVVSTPPTIGDSSRPSTIASSDFRHMGTIPSTTDVYRMNSMPATHGTNHTFYTVQKPSHRSNGSPTTHMPTTSHTDIYSHHAIQQPNHAPNSPRHHPQSPRSHSGHVSPSSPTDPTAARHNPLPEPPRLLSYQVPPLPPSLAGPRDSTASEYRAKYAGLTTTH
ncbi:hypothetical protein CERSUDRAFT_61918 [Gelatoporia subvermispora B]|uniref:Uncharacterized protein n=1 Tax=Ceriporiopsis subvermispora (strain B) TaxID=914234 RepID=M2RBZ3_CERS8|nr:hypothetical protein CERSUDRAFT_61918 [Gelatoporia subvermispora B]